MDRAFSNVTIKTISEDRREFEGWASTGARDRHDDELAPDGAVFELPLPVLLDHDHRQVVGECYRAEVGKRGIRFWARIQKIAEPGIAKDLVDYAWALIKNRLRPMVSVGFRPLEWEPIQGGALRYLKWEWYELSACAVGANPDARITAAKSARSPVVTVECRRPKPLPVVKLNPVERARIAGTLKINVAPKWKPGDPIKIKNTGPRVVKLDPQLRPPEEPARPLPVVKLTATDIERGKRRAAHRVVKLGRP